MHYLVSCSIVKDEDSYIEEFVEYHKLVGIEHFIFYDRSNNPISEKFQGRSDVTVHHFPEPKCHQDAWLQCMKDYRNFSKWTAFFDIDQFMVPKQTNDMRAILEQYESFAAFAINWQMFGNNGHISKPPGGVLENFTKRAQSDWHINRHIQTIGQIPRMLPIRPGDPHSFQYAGGEMCVNERFEQVIGPFAGPYHDKAQLNHYYTKSRQEYDAKLAKKRADIPDCPHDDLWDKFQPLCNDVEDRLALNIWLKRCPESDGTTIPQLDNC